MDLFIVIACFTVLIFVAVITFDSGPMIDEDLADAFEYDKRQVKLSKIIEGRDK